MISLAVFCKGDVMKCAKADGSCFSKGRTINKKAP